MDTITIIWGPTKAFYDVVFLPKGVITKFSFRSLACTEILEDNPELIPLDYVRKNPSGWDMLMLGKVVDTDHTLESYLYNYYPELML
jgi:hypothetical protein